MTSSKTTKRALFSSALAMVMCVAMLIGTTFAWFTDTASTSVNKIQAGTLKVGIEMATAWNEAGEPTAWADAENQTLKFRKSESAAENESILWEPGCTYKLPELRVVNKGDLALKYTIQITGIQGDAKLNEAIEWEMTGIDNGNLFANATSGNITITGHMKEAAGNEYQGLSIEGISITVYATQLAHEYDSNENQYDANAPLASYWDGKTTEAFTTDAEGKYHIKNAAQFAKLMEETSKGHSNSLYLGKTFVLDCDIDFGGRTISGIGSDNDNIVFTFDGNGHTLSNFKINNTREFYSGLFNQFNGTVTSLTVENATVIGNKMVGVIASNVEDGVIDNCHVKNATVIANVKKVGAITGYTSNGTVTNCTATNVNIYCANTDANESGEIVGYVNTGSTVNGNTATNVTVNRGATSVSASEQLKTAMLQGGNIILLNDITVDSWESIKVDTSSVYQPIADYIVIDGAGHTISGLNNPLLAPNASRNITIKNLTIKDSNIGYGSVAGAHNGGAFVPYIDNYVRTLVLENCHTVNVNVTAGRGSASSAGALVGYCYTHKSDSQSSVVNITNCTVQGGSVTNAHGNAAGIVGMLATGTTEDSYLIENCKVENCTISGETTAKQGAIVGTVNNDGRLDINNCTYTGNVYGRVVGATTAVYINGTKAN